MKNNDTKFKILEKLELITYIALVLYLLDIMFLGSGDITRQLGISTRMIFFVIALLGCIPGLLMEIKNVLKNKYCWLIVIFMIIIGVNLIRGIIVGNSRVIMITDVRGFLNYLIFFPMLYTLTNKERVLRLIKIFAHSATVVAVAAVFLSFFSTFPIGMQEKVYDFVNDYKICGISSLNSTVVRIFFHTAGRWFFVAFMFALAFSVLEKKNKKIWIVEMSVLMVASFVSFTRSIYFGICISVMFLVIFVLICYKEYFKTMLKNSIIMACVTVLVLFGMGIGVNGNMFHVAIQRTFLITSATSDEEFEENFVNSDAEEQNLEIRGSREEIVWENITKSPLIGHGLGLVNDANGEHIEYFYHDVWSKIGIIGLIVFLLPYIVHVWDLIRKKDMYGEEQKILALVGNSALLYLLVITYFNPCMNTTVGLSIYALVIVLALPWKQNC